MKYPLVKQNGLNNCGPCSLLSIIMYYGGYMSLDTLEIMMNTNKKGTSALNIVETARKIGFESHGLKKDNLDNLNPPFIAYVKIKESGHFVVVYKISDKILVGDPAFGLKYMTYDEFYDIWDKVVIFLTPIRKLPNNKPKSLFNYIKSILFKNKFLLFYLIIISIISAFISLLYSLLIRYIIDDTNFFINSYLFFIFIFILKYLLIWHKNNTMINLNKKISLNLTNGVIDSLISLPYIYYKNHRTGEILTRFNDLNAIIKYIDDVIISISIIPFIGVFLIFLYVKFKILFMYLIFILLIYIILSYLISFILNKKIKELKLSNASYNASFVEVLNAFETIKGINIERYMKDKLMGKYKLYENTLCETSKTYNLEEIILDIVSDIGFIILFIISIYYVKIGFITIGIIVSLYLIYNYLIELLKTFMNVLISYKEASNASIRIQELHYKITSKKIDIGNIEFRNVSYKVGLKYILKDINLLLKKGEKVILSGESGSGKSTFAKALKGYYDIKGIYIDNNLIEGKMENISYVSQNDYLFENTIHSNLLCDDNNKIKRVIEMCHVNNNPYTYVFENGFNLSGGEKAKIVLARTLLKPFDVLIIDEILDKLDLSEEREILSNLFSFYKDKIIIVITHRISNIDLYNHYLEMHNGLIINDRVL